MYYYTVFLVRTKFWLGSRPYSQCECQLAQLYSLSALNPFPKNKKIKKEVFLKCQSFTPVFKQMKCHPNYSTVNLMLMVVLVVLVLML